MPLVARDHVEEAFPVVLAEDVQEFCKVRYMMWGTPI